MSSPAVLIATLKLRPGQDDALAEWRARHDKAVSRFPGFLSSDAIPPIKEGDNEWTIILNFRTEEELVCWQRSPERGAIVGEALPLLEGGHLGEIMPKDDSAERPGVNVTQVILSRVKPGMEEEYRAWSTRIQQAQARYPGSRGTYVQPPTKADHGRWTVMLRYDSQAHLDAWLSSSERARLLDEAKSFVEHEELFRLATAFPGWVPVNPVTGQAPPNWKTALLVLLGLYPIVMLEITFLNPHLTAFNHATSVFIAISCTVCITTFITMPLFVRGFGWWLFPKKDTSSATTLKGIFFLAVLFVLEVILLGYLL